MNTYGQFCPVSKAMEVLDERWTMLVIRELMMGSRHFNELRRGMPRMSPALLSKRLRSLARAGIVERRDDGPRVTYTLTTAGQELGPIVEAVGRWGIRWIPELGDEDLDPHLLLWDMHRNVDLTAVPEGRTVLRFDLHDVPAPARYWWMLITPDDVDLCDFDPGHPEHASVEADLRTLSMVWRGDLSWSEALAQWPGRGPWCRLGTPSRPPMARPVLVRGRPTPARIGLSACAPPAGRGSAARGVPTRVRATTGPLV